MSGTNQIELGLTIPLQRHLRVKALPYGQEPDRRFCWDVHIIFLRGLRGAGRGGGSPSGVVLTCRMRLVDIVPPQILGWGAPKTAGRNGG